MLIHGPDFQAQVDAVRSHIPTVRHVVTLEDSPLRQDSDVLFAARNALPDTPLPPVELEPTDPWVLCYTGGSTGLPKAAILTHGSITANAANTVVSWGLTSDDVALLNAPLFHTGGLNVFTMPLVYVGGASVVCRGFDVEQVFDRVHRGEVSLVFGVQDAKWGEVPRALIVSRPGTSPTAEALLAYCQGRLARYKTPKTVRFVDALPRTAAGKVDRRELATRHGAP